MLVCEVTKQTCWINLILVNRDSREFFLALIKNDVFDAASQFQTNHVIHLNAPSKMYHVMNFFAWCHQTCTVLCAVCFAERRDEENLRRDGIKKNSRLMVHSNAPLDWFKTKLRH